jgi:predicted Zn finger-like uncharacterized protein
MILTCPECATRYFVADEKLSGAGRTVRCNACGTRWSAKAEDEPLELTPEPVETPADAASAPLPIAFRAKVAEKRSVRRAMAHGVVWAAMAAVVVLALATGIVFRGDIVRAAPRTASLYAMIGLPVNALGLTLEDVEARPALQDGHAALVVSGVVRNIEGRTVAAPALKVGVLDAHGAEVAVMIEALADHEIGAGESRNFVISVLDPPPSAQDVEVAFATGAAPSPSAHNTRDGEAEAGETGGPSLRGSSESHEPAADRAELYPVAGAAHGDTPELADAH